MCKFKVLVHIAFRYGRVSTNLDILCPSCFCRKNSLISTPGGGALEYESDGYVPTGERKQGAFGVGFRRKKGVIGCGIQKNWAFFGVNFLK